MNQISGMLKSGLLCLALAFLFSCQSKNEEMTFAEDVAFMQEHTNAFVLQNQEGARILLVPEYQGRVMTSATGGENDFSFGWINYDLVSKGEFTPHISPFGGEDRFWLGPEGGQFSIFFAEGASFDLQDWYTPAAIDTVTYDIINKTATSARFGKSVEVSNYAGFTFQMAVDREIKLLDKQQISELLEIDIPATVNQVGYYSHNIITNQGKEPWQKESGLLSIWILGMYKPSSSATIIIPYLGEQSGLEVNDEYFGSISDDRLIIADAIYLKADGQSRGKLGLPYQHAPEVLGSYDAANQVLTVVTYAKPDTTSDYVNSLWKIQDEPYAGDVVNAYNDGPPTPGSDQLGPFYELETSSPALALQPGESASHIHRTFHFQGDPELLDDIARQVLGVGVVRNEYLFR